MDYPSGLSVAFFLPGVRKLPRQIGRTKGTICDAVESQTMIANQLVNRQKKVTSLVELKLTPGQLFN